MYRFEPDTHNDDYERPSVRTRAHKCFYYARVCVQYKLPSDKVLADLSLDEYGGSWICNVHEHDSLLQEGEDEDLTEAERNKAWEDYVNNRDLLHDNRAQMFATAATIGRGACKLVRSVGNVYCAQIQRVHSMKVRF
jgi:hypothetical protein